MKKIGVFLLLLLPVLLAWSLPRFIGDHKHEAILKVVCPDLVQGCQVPFGVMKAEVRFLSAPSTLQRFGLEVKALGAGYVAADFDMLGMNMGPNHLNLIPSTNGLWTGQILLPVCSVGARNWIMTLEIDGLKRQMEFLVAKH